MQFERQKTVISLTWAVSFLKDMVRQVTYSVHLLTEGYKCVCVLYFNDIMYVKWQYCIFTQYVSEVFDTPAPPP